MATTTKTVRAFGSNANVVPEPASAINLQLVSQRVAQESIDAVNDREVLNNLSGRPQSPYRGAEGGVISNSSYDPEQIYGRSSQAIAKHSFANGYWCRSYYEGSTSTGYGSWTNSDYSKAEGMFALGWMPGSHSRGAAAFYNADGSPQALHPPQSINGTHASIAQSESALVVFRGKGPLTAGERVPLQLKMFEPYSAKNLWHFDIKAIGRNPTTGETYVKNIILAYDTGQLTGYQTSARTFTVVTNTADTAGDPNARLTYTLTPGYVNSPHLNFFAPINDVVAVKIERLSLYSNVELGNINGSKYVAW